MAVKFFCPKCERRFVEWGAQKLDFKCPTDDCNEETLRPVGAAALEVEEKTKAKGGKRAKTVVPISNPEDDVSEIDGGFVEGNTLDVDDDEDDELEEEEEEPVVMPVKISADNDKDVAEEEEEPDDEDDDTFVEALDLDDDTGGRDA